MTGVYFNATMSDDERREAIYAGELFVYSPSAPSRGLCNLARELSEEAFSPYDPELAQYEIPVEEYVSILAELKPKFIHHPAAKKLIPEILSVLECDLNRTYFDVPRLRTATHGGYLTSGIAYAFKPHRDTWFSAPFSQINWWLPVYPMSADNGMAFHPQYWSTPVKNSSRGYNYQVWTRTGRKTAAQQIGRDTRVQPEAEEELTTDPDLRLVLEPGAIVIFSAAQLHSTVENTSGRTRFSVDFRTVNLDDLRCVAGAPNIDSACTGTTIDDYLRGTDLAQLPSDLRAELLGS